jgi:YD repeat-containing protein
VMWSSRLKIPFALADNAVNTTSLKEFYYEGFEESTASGLYTGNGHTGTKSIFAPYTVSWALPNSRSYVISYWYFANSVWTYQPEQPLTGSMTLSGGTAYDDIRIHPKDATMVTYTYDAGGNLTSSTDAKSLTTYYEYDSFQRLRNIRDYQKNIIKSICYNYNGQANGCFINMPSYSNITYTSSYTRSSCASGYSGLPVLYTVPTGTYISNISQEDADNQAQQDAALNGLTYANINGGCVINVSFTLGNTTNSGYQINFSNSLSSYTYNFLNSGTTTIQIPAGTYNISAYPTGAYVVHTITLTGQDPVTAPRASFSGISVTTGSNLTLSIQ